MVDPSIFQDMTWDFIWPIVGMLTVTCTLISLVVIGLIRDAFKKD